MSTKMLVTMKLDQRLMMSQQLRQAITLLQYNTLDLKQLVQQQIESNPLLEVDEMESVETTDESTSEFSYSDEDSTHTNNFSADLSKRSQFYEEESTLENYSIPKSLRNHLLEQALACRFDAQQHIIAVAIIDAIDDKGYLTMPLEDIQKTIKILDAQIDLEQMKNVLKTIQAFEPVGVGTSDLRECLLIQLDFLPNQDKIWHVAHDILSQYFEVISLTNPKKLIKQLGVTAEEYSSAITLIRSLNPDPGINYSTDMNINIEPEIYVKKIKKTWRVFLTNSILTSVKINNQYKELIKKNKKDSSFQSLKHELNEAQNLLSGLKRRNETLFSVASYIVELQKDFFEHGHAHMKSMNIVDVSQALNVHESTVSRITTGKYMATPRGVFELKYFFPSQVSTASGDGCSAIAVKSMIKEIVSQETDGHIFSDEEIANLLKEKGINIARRTVAKYREALKILPSYQRMRMQPCS